MSLPIPSQAKVAVIGAGVSGLAAAKRLSEEGFNVTLYDRRALPGGLWNYSKQPQDPASLTASERFASAVYGDLQTNFPRPLMEFQDFPCKGNQPIFMSHDRVLRYLKDYANTMAGEVRLRADREVVRLYCTGAGTEEDCVWHLTTRDCSTKHEVSAEFSAVVVANGVFDKPFYPPLDGLKEWMERCPEHISHSGTYRGPRAFKGKKVLIVGYGASGWDIANKLGDVKTNKYPPSEIWVSTSRGASAGPIPDTARRAGSIKRLDPRGRQVLFEDGQTLRRVDHIIFCTGYQYSQPFIRYNKHATGPLFPSGKTIEGLHEHMIYKGNPTLAFVGLIMGGAPTFLVAQAQTAFISRLWAGRLPKKQLEGLNSEQDDDSKHTMQYPKWMEYLLRLEKACEGAGRSQHTLDGGNAPFRWTLELDWVFANRGKIRDRFKELAERGDGKKATSLSELGFSVADLEPRARDANTLLPFLILQAGYFPGRPLDLSRKVLSASGLDEEAVRRPGVAVERIKEASRKLHRGRDPARALLVEAGVGRLLECLLGRSHPQSDMRQEGKQEDVLDDESVASGISRTDWAERVVPGSPILSRGIVERRW